MATLASPEIRTDNSLLIVDDDKPFLSRLAKAMEARGYAVRTAETLEAGKQAIREAAPAYAVVDMRLDDGNGLEVIKLLRETRPDCRSLVLTGYGNIATAVTAVKLGAVDYLSKPADAEDILAALTASGETKPKPPENPMSADRVRWEHIQRVYELCNRNVSETARRLHMHRRTLQRILAKRAPK
ncbi:response regulator receiver protein [Rhodomicrobium vannielii ATCC 17100]|jgi:two-component system response regulator RegA|uniref:Response regulator receiver protein n=2 Tax=Rhodomicrobium TaxID=1068 RepID=E3I6H4_RHOVT|nr:MULTISPECIES: ActR/PrrA/RegA family redox response regulator transcription factor [Rhodomicrobium]ADP69535.1 response regulator receiver protein [Rhodomicrobium vannielii ATCC 17100]KAI96396.1 chemotaxis protein CheY [Rhodomicrobium udaipurense JA643]MBJ7534658.1 ActR/PrrA/RegA family redox response regulator transcription factor [Rhodomicrobium vannielii ATCC 17100]MBJ7544524.1 ActR/PrrA/RegA family redox response regulator transcription factor [Rhodomicrobium udaipurense]